MLEVQQGMYSASVHVMYKSTTCETRAVSGLLSFEQSSAGYEV